MMYKLMQFEEIGITYYSENEANSRVLTHPSCADLKDKVKANGKKTKNPYKESYIWLKGELLDIQGMIECLNGRESVMKA